MKLVSDISETLQLTSNIEVSAGCHILYTYTEKSRYIENTTAFLAEGIDKDQVVIYTDTPEYIAIVKDNLLKAGYSMKQLNEIKFVDPDIFYNGETEDHAYHFFSDLIRPANEENKTLRTWGRVVWDSTSKSMYERILSMVEYESQCDCLITGRKNLISVCAYDTLGMPSSFLINLLKVHEYHMTDEIFNHSHLYHKKPVTFPSISEQIKLEKVAFDQLIQSEKLSVAGQLAAGIAHEIRNPIAAIKGFIQLLEAENKGNHQYIRIIKSEVEKIQLISSEFLALAKPQIEDKKEVNVVQLMDNVKTLLEPQALSKCIGIEFLFTPEQKDIVITCDEVKIRQVLINIIKNAIEAMEKGFITLGIQENNDDLYIRVADEGPGIPKDIIDKLGQAFFTTKESGNGLGLLVSHKIIGDHDGQLVVESEEGKGTVFTIKLPNK